MAEDIHEHGDPPDTSPDPGPVPCICGQMPEYFADLEYWACNGGHADPKHDCWVGPTQDPDHVQWDAVMRAARSDSL